MECFSQMVLNLSLTRSRVPPRGKKRSSPFHVSSLITIRLYRLRSSHKQTGQTADSSPQTYPDAFWSTVVALRVTVVLKYRGIACLSFPLQCLTLKTSTGSNSE